MNPKKWQAVKSVQKMVKISCIDDHFGWSLGDKQGNLRGWEFLGL